MRKKKEYKNEAGWLRIYSGAVTVLLCFVVVLYGGTSFHESDFTDGYTQFETPGQLSSKNSSQNNGNKIDKKFSQLYKKLRKKQKDTFIVENGGESIRIRISNERLFKENETTLKKGAISILDSILVELKTNKNVIGKIVISGHTMQKDPDLPNEAVTDRMLSAERAAKISAYIQQKEIVEPSSILSVGCGQFFPITTIKTELEKNDRLEITIEKVISKWGDPKL